MVRVRAPQDLLAGIFLLGLGSVGLVYGAGLGLGGKVTLIGPGYLPRILSWALLGFGTVLIAQSLMIDGDRITRPPVGRVAAILGSLLVFAVSVETVGLVLATAAQVLVAWLAAPERRWREGIVLSVVLSLGAAALFGVALRLPFKLWPM